MKGLLGAATRDEDRPTEEVRFGVVLNGGVSLAVWMGGTVHELDRLTKALERDEKRNPYALLLRLTGCTARADVFAGTSAGGINGAALALAQVNRDADLGILRGLWIEQGRIESLLRQPFQGDPTSLLRGDEYFLPALHDAMSRLAHAPGNRGPQDSPVDLTITTTVLRGNQTITLDSMGQKLPQTVHAGLFHWHRSAGSPQATDPFDPANIELTAHQLALASRSTASFPVAFEPSFIPVNSPDFPVHASGAPLVFATEAQRLRPDMSRVVRSWGSGSSKQNKSRYVIDGGVLANTPTMPALRAVEGMQAEGPVRRVMLLVYPHAPSPDEDTPAAFDTAPTVAGALSGLLGALSGQGGRTYVDQLEEHNRRAAGRRGTRSDILDVTPPDQLGTLARQIYPHYRQLRAWRAARDLASRMAGNVDDGTTSMALPEGWTYERVRIEAERAQQAWQAQYIALPYVPADLPADPQRPTPGTPDPETPHPQPPNPQPAGWGWGVSGALGVAEAANELLRQLVATLSKVDDDFRVVTAARRRTFELRAAFEPMRAAVDTAWATDRGDGHDDVIATLAPNHRYWTLRLAYYDHLMVGSTKWDAVVDLIGQVAQSEGDLAADRVPTGSMEISGVQEERKAEVRTALTKRLNTKAAADAAANSARGGAPAARHTAAAPHAPQNAEQNAGAVGQQIRLLVEAVVAELAAVIKVLYRKDSPAADRPAVDAKSRSYHETLKWGRGLGLGQADLSTESLLVRLLHLEVAATALGDEVSTGATQPVELVQLSAQTKNDFAEYSRTADDKLGGWSLNRFGGFLKRSWRANDWTWGRVDAVTVLCRTVLHPSRIRRTARLTGYLDECTPDDLIAKLSAEQVDKLVEKMVDETLQELVQELFGEQRPDLKSLRAEAKRELTRVLDKRVNEGDLPASLPALSDLFARALHEQIVVHELPSIATAIRADTVEGGYQRSRGEVFLASESALLLRLDQAELLTAKQRTRALEAFDGAGIGREPLREESSSDLTIRTATTAASVGVTVLSSGRSGLKAMSPIAKALRGLMLPSYWVVTGLTAKSGLARTLSLLALALGGTLLALSLFGALPESFSGPATALGASAVLVAFAYGALRTGTLLHGVVLLSPVIPLLTYSVIRARDSEDASVAQGSTTLVVVIALAVVLMLLGSFGATYGSVWSALDRLADRRGVRRMTKPRAAKPPKPRRPVVRRLQAVFRALWPVLLGLLVAVAVAAVVTAALRTDWVQRMSDWKWDAAWTWGLVVGGLAAATLLGAAIALVAGNSLQVLARVPEPNAEGKVQFGRAVNVRFTWQHQRVANPRGVAVGWAVLYGIGYELLVVALLLDPFHRHEEWWYRVALITAALFAATLVLVTPWLLPVLEYRAIRRMEQTRGAGCTGGDDEHDPSQAYAADLANRGLGYRHYVKEGPTPTLTWFGTRMLNSVLKASGPQP